MIKNHLSLLVLLVPLLAMPTGPASAFEQINKSFFGGVALGGYDAVSYFTEAKAVEGDKAFSVQWQGASWLFSSDDNRRRFRADPKAFAPQYGGYCSNQMSLANLSDIDPKVWRVIDHKLYLFGHEEGRVRWAEKTQLRISEANRHWQTYLAR